MTNVQIVEHWKHYRPGDTYVAPSAAAATDLINAGVAIASTGTGATTPQQMRTRVVTSGGAAQTIPDPNLYDESAITLTAACTLTWPTLYAGARWRIYLVQGGTGGFQPVWPNTTKWSGGTSGTATSGVGKVSGFEFTTVDGVNVLGQVLDLDYR